MNVRSTRPRVERASQRREQLLELALRMFGEEGWEGTTIRNLATRAGVSLGLLYHYFRNKEELLVAVMDHYSMLPELRAIIERHRDRPASEVLLDMCYEIHQRIRERREVCWILFREARQHAEVDQRMRGIRDEGTRLLADYLQARVEAGELRPHNSSVLARALMSVMFLRVLVDEPADGFLPDLVDCYLRGLLAR
ncbi:MAG: TetR/AcrR family transcriptional regulator [Candidatus Eremiobacterota bacterium]